MHKIFHDLYECLPFKLIALKRKHSLLHFEKFLKKKLRQFDNSDYLTSNCFSNSVWVYWHQGVENAPSIVKACINSIVRQCNFQNLNVRILSYNSLADYVSIDKRIVKKMEGGELSLAHFSDIVRLTILSKYGGCWIDSTVFLTGNIPNMILNSNFFVFRGSTFEDLSLQNPSCVSNWFIYSKPGQEMINKTLYLMTEYICTHRKMFSYYLCHHIITFLFKTNVALWKEMPLLLNVNPHLIQFYYKDEQYNPILYSQIIKNSFCHKLSYKLDSKSGSILDFISKGGDANV